MAKLNRRDYLRQMGVAAGAIASTPALELFSQERTAEKDSVCSSGNEQPIVWLPRQTRWPFPDDTSVKLIFMGLMGFCRRVQGNTTTCEVGIHSEEEGDDEHHHKFSIHTCQLPSARRNRRQVRKAQEVREFHNLRDVTPQLSIVNPSFTGVAFYQPEEVMSRRGLTNDNDFRWIVDFESKYLYGKHFKAGHTTLDKEDNFYKPKLTIEHGVFYTLRKTASTFRAQTKNGKCVSDLRNVADIIAAKTYLAGGGSVTLTIGEVSVTLRPPAEIFFMNHCFGDSGHSVECPKEPHNLEEKKKRSDFFLHYKGFDYRKNTESDTREYELFLVEPGKPEDPDFGCFSEKQKFLNATAKQKKISDESPCAGSGYGGGSGGFPP